MAPSASATQAVPAPAVTGISPASGPAGGGTTVTITGSGFTGASAVTFGAMGATHVTVVSDTEITAKSPAQPAGLVDIAVTTAGGVSRLATADQFTYAAAPAVTGISPASGPAGGGTTVTITGSGFTGASAVSFGTVPAASYTVESSTQITAVSPAHAKGSLRIRVTTPGGTSPAVAASKFTYQAAAGG